MSVKYSDFLIGRIRDIKSEIQIDISSLSLVSKNLLFLYHFCVASERLLIDASDEEPKDRFKDSFETRLSEYYDRHLAEESDEIRILKEDLDSAGITIGPPDRYSMAMVGTQYYLLKHVHPVALMGYLAVQEADPTPLEVVAILESLYGKHLFRFLRMHAIKDLEHRKEIIDILDEIPSEFERLVLNSAENALLHCREACDSWK